MCILKSLIAYARELKIAPIGKSYKIATRCFRILDGEGNLKMLS
jgi:hypothetical protein